MDLNAYLPPRVAVVELTGVIGVRLHARDFTHLVRQIRRNPRYKAVVVDIDSPGGSAFASEDIYLSIRKLAEAKPVVTAIRGMGASGGYMAACAGERIWALPSSVVGSIGVITARPMVEDLLEKVGVEMLVTKKGRLKDMGSVFREPTDEERVKEEELLEGIFSRFLEIVGESRPGLEAGRLRDLATGEVYLGSKAVELGLVDELGGLDDAVAWAADRAGITARTSVLRPRRSLAQMIFSRAANAMVDSVTAELLERAYARALAVPRV